mmetsp:Transcript_20487/g.44582  ORF Transcript_20487/g.44582 Transcript_20487/m.44582 type:complete len:227 (-) Transcript_20487:112-792(-)
MYTIAIPTETMLRTTASSDELRIDNDKITQTYNDDETVTTIGFSDSENSFPDLSLPETQGPLSGPSSIQTESDSTLSVLSRSSSASSINTLSENLTGIKKRVSFDAVKIRSYQQTMGDNPSVSYGPPIQLDWDYEEHNGIDIDAFEADRGLSRRTMRQMHISYYQRKHFLMRECGFTEGEVAKAKKDANKVKFLRDVTRTLLPVMKVEDALESAGRKAKRIISKRR